MSEEAHDVNNFFQELIHTDLIIFPEYRKPLNAPKEQGVYIIYSDAEKVVHVGRTPRAKGGIAQRLRNHMAGSSSFINKYLNGDGSKLRGKYKFRCIRVSDPRIRALLEAYTIGRLCPAHLGLGIIDDA